MNKLNLNNIHTQDDLDIWIRNNIILYTNNIEIQRACYNIRYNIVRKELNLPLCPISMAYK